MKKVLFVLVVLLVGRARADNIVTSREYVDAQANTLQSELPAKNTNTVLTNTATAGEIGEKAIYDASAAFGTQTDALVTAGTFNTAVQNALDSEFVCIERQNGNGGCLLYEIRAATQKQILPSGYTQLEYLESTRTQYIITNIPWDTVHRFRGKAQQSSINMINRSVLGSSTGSGAVHNFWGTRYLPSQNGKTYWYWETDIQPTIAATFDIARNTDSGWTGTVNDTITTDNGASTFLGSVVIMNVYFPSTQNPYYRAFNGHIWYIQLFGVNGNMLFNGIPARRNSDGELGMYDTVTNTFFTNSGTGEFIAGPTVSSNLYLPSGN